jgi:ABC-type Fe3+ transport system substrate-binding protein
MFDAFTEKTGIQVKSHAGEKELFERLQSEGRTPADVFMTVDVGNLWMAEHAALLQDHLRSSTRTSPAICGRKTTNGRVAVGACTPHHV